MIKNLFYFLYWFLTKYKVVQNPSIHSFTHICVIIGLNLATLYNILFHFYDISLVNKGIDLRFWGLIIGLIIMIINYFTWYSKRQIIIVKYKQMPRKEKVRRSVLSIVYVVVSLLGFYFTAKAFLPWA